MLLELFLAEEHCLQVSLMGPDFGMYMRSASLSVTLTDHFGCFFQEHSFSIYYWRIGNWNLSSFGRSDITVCWLWLSWRTVPIPCINHRRGVLFFQGHNADSFSASSESGISTIFRGVNKLLMGMIKMSSYHKAIFQLHFYLHCWKNMTCYIASVNLGLRSSLHTHFLLLPESHKLLMICCVSGFWLNSFLFNSF